MRRRGDDEGQKKKQKSSCHSSSLGHSGSKRIDWALSFDINLGHKSLWSCYPSRILHCSPIGGAVFHLLLKWGPLFQRASLHRSWWSHARWARRSIRADICTQGTKWVTMAKFLFRSSTHPIKLQRGDAVLAHVQADLVGVSLCLAFKEIIN